MYASMCAWACVCGVCTVRMYLNVCIPYTTILSRDLQGGVCQVKMSSVYVKEQDSLGGVKK